eukprot:g1364.t1
MRIRALLLCAIGAVGCADEATVLPAPFSRVLRVAAPPLNGSDVTVLQHLLARAPGECALPPAVCAPGAYDAATARAVACVQQRWGLTSGGSGGGGGGSSGVFDNATAWAVLARLSADGWRDDGRSARALGGYKYKVLLPVHRTNRSREMVGTLLDADNNVLLRFPARTHGLDADAAGRPVTGVAWPDLTDDGCPRGATRQGCAGLNEFSPSGATPTGLVEIDLNSPEDAPELYGPYPVNRFVRGVAGNARFLLPALRNGILIHSGYWANHSSWRPGQPMPNSAGCVHSELASVQQIWRLLTEQCGVKVRPNTNGQLPYPYKPQGIAAVYSVA